jgi:hypothetical protein
MTTVSPGFRFLSAVIRHPLSPPFDAKIFLGFVCAVAEQRMKKEMKMTRIDFMFAIMLIH